MTLDPHPYARRRACLATRHDKGRLIAPWLRSIPISVVEVSIDTDAFGTFAGDISRQLPPLQTAIAKAEAGMAASGLGLGIASEGTISTSPALTPVTTELVVLVDEARGTAVCERATGPVRAVSAAVSANQDVSALLARADFPRHRVMVRPAAVPASDAEALHKGIGDEASLRSAINEAAAASPIGSAVVESDLRAHCSPSRQQVIGQAAAALARRVAARCPECGTPGWGRTAPILGLPCRECGHLAQNAVAGWLLACPACPAAAEERVKQDAVGPEHCPYCNP